MSAKISNSFAEKIRNNGIASTLSVRLVRSNEIAMMAKTAGYDGLLIDMEHSSLDVDQTSQLCVAALYADIAPIVRVPSNDSAYISRVLDGGALGVIIPHIRSVEDAQKAVHAAKFQPLGSRSATSGLPHFQFRSVPARAANAACNEATINIPMIETLEALELVDEIAAIDGVDSLLIGTNDLSAEMGIPGEFDHPRISEAYERTIAACRKHGKYVGVGGLNSRLDLVEKFCAMGASWVMAAADSGLLLSAATKRGKEMAALEAKVTAEYPRDVTKKVNGSH
ncbi:HpcH/HpaI aldolase [Xylariales sp. PMI_506]|nr:HpcH/HpaI aldolase [Xylariales sp. PMI_506]